MGDQDESELPDEIFGALRLKRKVGGTGYMYVTGPKRFSKKNPYQARVKNKRTGKTQNLGMYPSPHAAAIAVATVLGGGDNEQMESPRKHRKRGVQCSAPTPAMPDAIAHIACMLYVCLCGLCAISSPSVISARGVDYLFWLIWAELCDTDSPSLHRMHRAPPLHLLAIPHSHPDGLPRLWY
jgi:hypothetical protein